MEILKYVGMKPNSDLRTIGDEPINVVRFFQSERAVFRRGFRDKVGEIIRQSKGFRYKHLPAQHNAFDRLEEALINHQFELLEITPVEGESDEFVCRVQARIKVLSVFKDKLFQEPLPDGTCGYALVSFYIGVCRRFAGLLTREVLLNRTMGQFLSEEGRQELVTLEQKERAVAQHMVESAVKDPSFDPENIIPVLLKSLRLEKRYAYDHPNYEWSAFHVQRHYQSPEGYIYRIEIDGHVTQPS